MSAAPKLVPQEPIYSGTIPAAPTARPVPRPAPRKRLKLGRFVATGSVWAVFMLLCFMLVQKNAVIRNENANMALMREEILQLEQRNLELEGRIANQVSVAEVEKWAQAHNMNPPSGVVQTLQGKPEAVAVRQAPAPAPTQVQAAQEPQSFWQALMARFGGTANQAAGAKR